MKADRDVLMGLYVVVSSTQQEIPPKKTNIDTKNDGLEMVIQFKCGHFWYQFVKFWVGYNIEESLTEVAQNFFWRPKHGVPVFCTIFSSVATCIQEISNRTH